MLGGSVCLPVGEGAGLRPSLSVGMVMRSGGMGATLSAAPPASTSDWNSSRMFVDGKRNVHLETSTVHSSVYSPHLSVISRTSKEMSMRNILETATSQ